MPIDSSAMLAAVRNAQAARAQTSSAEVGVNVFAPLRYIRPAAIPGAEILSVTQNVSLWSVFHESYNVGITTSMASDWRYRGKNGFIKDRCLTFLEPGEAHFHTSMRKPADLKVLFFDNQTFIDAAREFGISGTPHFQITTSYHPELFAAFKRLFGAIDNAESALEQQSRHAHVLHLIFSNAIERMRTVPLEDNGMRAIRRAQAYLHEHFSEPISLDALAAIAGMSRFHLLRTFAKYFSLPPHAYQNHIRVARARALLQSGTPIKAIAPIVGFADQSHLARHFKRIYKLTPSRYAVEIRAEHVHRAG